MAQRRWWRGALLAGEHATLRLSPLRRGALLDGVTGRRLLCASLGRGRGGWSQAGGGRGTGAHRRCFGLLSWLDENDWIADLDSEDAPFRRPAAFLDATWPTVSDLSRETGSARPLAVQAILLQAATCAESPRTALLRRRAASIWDVQPPSRTSSLSLLLPSTRHLHPPAHKLRASARARVAGVSSRRDRGACHSALRQVSARERKTAAAPPRRR